jgi:hypothetical protein
MGIQVASTDDVLAMRDKWAEAGLETRDEMQIVCGYALQDKSWIADPDGNEWEVFVVHKDNLPTYYAQEGGTNCGGTESESCPASAKSAVDSCGASRPETSSTSGVKR